VNYQEWSTSVDARLMEIRGLQQETIEMFREQERLRGLKPIRWKPSAFTATANLLLGAGGADSVPVEQGFVWDLRIISGKLSAQDSVAAYIGETNNGPLIGYQPTGAAPTQNVFVILIPKSSAILNAGETLFLQTSGAGTITAVNINAWSAPGEMVGKLF